MTWPAILDVLGHRLRELEQMPWSAFAVPGLWVGTDTRSVYSTPPTYHRCQLEAIEQRAREHDKARDGENPGLTYYAMIRHCTAYDHGELCDNEGWTSDGTILKMLSMLPYLHDMGVRTIIVLPIMHRGRVGRKGTKGSPYAIRHPLRLDHELVEMALGLDVDTMFRMFMAAAHVLGIKVLVEVVLRTASIDSDLVDTNPEWFYWVKEEAIRNGRFQQPTFDTASRALATEMVTNGDRTGLPAPDADYQAQFAGVPRTVQIDDEGWLGIGHGGQRLRIPGAFADWPPDDPQPLWEDVTYLRLFDHPDFNYMAYNTIRYYDAVLERQAYQITGAWNLVASIIPHYMRQYGVDGAMVDMGHALPTQLQENVVRAVRSQSVDAVLYEEQFHLDAASVRSGYNGVVGYLPFIAHDAEKLREFVRLVAASDIPVRYFATPETHNTPRAASRDGGYAFAHGIWCMLHCLPRGIPVLHAGIELGATMPVNTGLGFTLDDMQAWTPDRLPLFSSASLPWDEGISCATTFRGQIQGMATKHWYRQMRDDDHVVPLSPDQDCVVGFLRYGRRASTGVIVIVNLSSETINITIDIPAPFRHVVPAVDTGARTQADGHIAVHCDAWECRQIPVWLTFT